MSAQGFQGNYICTSTKRRTLLVVRLYTMDHVCVYTHIDTKHTFYY
jgi:hypothetical protein